MSRLGPWTPQSVEERLDRMESVTAIQQLAYRYARAVDSRDIDALVGLFVADVRVGREVTGRGALKGWFVDTLRSFKSSCHFVGNHIIDFDDADHARGTVYCHDELDRPDAGKWNQGQLQYWDTYRRDGGEWYFVRRKFHRLYITDWLNRPEHGAGNRPGEEALTSHQLPEAYPSWAEFWANV